MLASSRLLTSRQVATCKAETATSALPTTRETLRLRARSLSTTPTSTTTTTTRSSVAIPAPALPSFRKSAMAAAASPSSAASSALVKDKTPFIIVGSGRVGEALAEMGENDLLVRRDDPIPSPSDPAFPLGTPIVVCTRNDALDSVLDKTPAERRRDLVFIQNGMLQPWLASKGLDSGGDAATQVLVFFAVSAKGEAPVDGVTDTDPQGLTAAHGRHAAAFAARLRGSGGLSCRELESRAAFDAAALEKLVWICAFMLVGASRGAGVTVGEVDSAHSAEVAALIAELAAGGARALGLSEALLPGPEGALVARLRAYARSVAHFPTAVKEFEWRNGWFWELSRKSEEGGGGDPFPTHSRLLREVGAV